MTPSPFANGYPGSKDASGASERILSLLPRHSVYVEPFLGGGAVLRRKSAALRSVGIDADAEVVAAWASVEYPGLEVVQGCGIAWMEAEGPALPDDALVYCDPPYVHSARSHRQIYRCELSEADHARLLDAADSLPCSVMISGYHTDLYAERLAGWQHEAFRVMTRGGPRIEHLWWRSSIAAYAGGRGRAGRDYRERERIKRKAGRWVSNLMACPRYEREAILAALIDAAGTADAGDVAGSLASGDGVGRRPTPPGVTV